ncbi:CBS domain-containing protein [bacterium]|nr:CBS domain-containing protein [bacterium]
MEETKQASAFSLEEILKTDKIRHLRPHAVPMLGRKATVRDAVEAMRKTRRGCILVCHGKNIVGIFTERDVLLKVSDGSEESLRLPLEKVMTPDPQTISVNDSILDAIRIMVGKGFRHLAVIGEKGEGVGTISMRNVLAYLAEHFPEAVYNLPPVSDQINEERDGA